MAYKVGWLPTAQEELEIFPKRFQDTIIRKVDNVADHIPTSLSLLTVQRIKGQDRLALPCIIWELDIGKGPRAAFGLYEDRQLLLVYLVGTHDYCKRNYLSAATRRL